jgi:acetyl esterase/lipase
MVGDKATFFNELGYVFVSVNYRLSDPRDPNRVVHPTHAEDVGSALTWVEKNIDDYGGNGKRIALMGHSAGGHLVSLVGVDPSVIEDSGGDPSAVKCVVSNDTEGYDVVTRTAQGGRVKLIYENGFGTDVAVQRDASPLTHVADQDPPPDFLVITRGTPTRVAAATQFADAVEAAGATSEVLEATGLTHSDVNRLLGSAGDTRVTPTVETFVTDCLG